MAKTYTANSYNIGTPAGTTIGNGKSLLGIFNAHASNIVKVWRVWMYPNTTAVTGVMIDVSLRLLSNLTSGTAVTAHAHNTANTSKDLTSITIVTNGTATASATIASYLIVTEEPVVSGAVNQNLMCFMPFSQLWDNGIGDDNVQPITLRQNEGLDLQCVTNSVAGNFDVIFEFTVE